MSNDLVITGDMIRNAREALGLTQAAAAEQWGVSRKTIFNWESWGEDPLPTRAQGRARAALHERSPLDPSVSTNDPARDRLALRLLEANETLRRAVETHGIDQVVKQMIAMHDQLGQAAEFIEGAARLQADPVSIRLAARTMSDLYIDSGVLRVLMGQDLQRAIEPLSKLSALAIYKHDAPTEDWILNRLSEADVTLAASDADVDAEVEAQQEEP